MEKREEIKHEANKNEIKVVGTHWILVTAGKNLKLFNNVGETNRETIS